MILKMLVVFYAWLWNIEIAQPTRENGGFLAIALSVMFFDLPAFVSICFGVCEIIKRIKGGTK